MSGLYRVEKLRNLCDSIPDFIGVEIEHKKRQTEPCVVISFPLGRKWFKEHYEATLIQKKKKGR